MLALGEGNLLGSLSTSRNGKFLHEHSSTSGMITLDRTCRQYLIA
jgi:hypothetical protein